jgi:hypothetical protein
MKVLPNQGRPSRLRRAGASLAVVALIGLPLAACSSGSSSDPSSASGNSSRSGNSSADAASNGDAEFAQCVRQHGVSTMPDPQGGHFLMPGSVTSNPSWPSAVQACQHYLPGGTLGGNSSGNSSALLNYAHCMQTHGVPQYPDPLSNGAIDMPKSIDPNSPTVQKAEQECKSDLPGGQG